MTIPQPPLNSPWPREGTCADPMTHALERRSDYWGRLAAAAERIGMPPPMIYRARMKPAIARWIRIRRRQAELEARLIRTGIELAIRWVMSQDKEPT